MYQFEKKAKSMPTTMLSWVIIAASFGDIFFSNCFQNGVLPISLPQTEVQRIAASISPAQPVICVDLEAQTISLASGERIRFEIEAYQKKMLLCGMEEIDLTLSHLSEIEAAEARDRAARPWLFRS